MLKAVPHPSQPTVLLVGGGSGGHIYPNLAVVERLPDEFRGHLVVSQRPLDAQIAEASGLGYTAIPASPLSVRPKAGLKFLRDYRRGVAETLKLIRQTDAKAMIATGGFVSGPAVSAARKARLPVALVSLDAVPGRANRFTAKKATNVFSAFETHQGTRALKCPSLSGDAEVIGFPLRRAAVALESVTPQAARQHFGLDPDRQTLLVFAGSQGARTINRAMGLLYEQDHFRGWQVLHITGPTDQGSGTSGGSVPVSDQVRTRPFCDRMDFAWRAADTAVTRCGAGTVAEAWANAVPSVMLPYPFHKDEHQKHNAAPLVALGGAVVVQDLVDATKNAARLSEAFATVLDNDNQRTAMRQKMLDHPPRDGAQHLTDWVVGVV